MLPILPPAPSRTDPTNFSAKADAWVDALDEWTDAANALEQSLQLVATTGTSTSSLPIGTGSKGLTTQTGKAWGVGSWVYIVSSSSITNTMQGQVTAYNSGTGALVVNVSSFTGTGTFSNWTIGLAVPPIGQGRLIGVKKYNVAGSYTYTPTIGTTAIIVHLTGAGGGCAGTPATGAGQTAFGSPGGSGGYGEFYMIVDFATASLTVGAGGTQGTTGANASNGGDSKLEITPLTRFCSAGGGGGGLIDPASNSFPRGSYNGGNAGAVGGLSTSNGSDVLIKRASGVKGYNSLSISTAINIVGPGGVPYGANYPGEEYVAQGPGKWSGTFTPGAGGRGHVNGPSSASQAQGQDGVDGSIIIYEYT